MSAIPEKRADLILRTCPQNVFLHFPLFLFDKELFFIKKDCRNIRAYLCIIRQEIIYHFTIWTPTCNLLPGIHRRLKLESFHKNKYELTWSNFYTLNLWQFSRVSRSRAIQYAISCSQLNSAIFIRNSQRSHINCIFNWRLL